MLGLSYTFYFCYQYLLRLKFKLAFFSQCVLINMTDKVTLYFTPPSPPARAVLLALRYFNIDVAVKNVSILENEQHSEYFKKLNPAGKVPVFVDTDEFTLSESRAILAYLVNSRSPGNDLYPNDPKKRALVDQRLYYDATIFFPIIANFVVSLKKFIHKIRSCSSFSCGVRFG